MTYGARHINRRRATNAEMEARYDALQSIVTVMHPMTVRQVFYQAEIRGIVEKSEAGYNKVQRALVEMRRDGRLPYNWIADNTRWQRKPRTFDGPEAALRDVAAFYRKSLWSTANAYCEVWLEKDALAGVVVEVTSEFDVPLMVSRGYSSLSFLHSAAQHIAALNVPAHLYHLGDFDPSGVDAGNKIEEALSQLAPDAEIHFERLAVLPEQISAWTLPTRPTKTTDTRAKGFGTISVELDAIDPVRLRGLVRRAIEVHLPPDQMEVLRVAEASERELLHQWADAVEAGR